MKILLVVVLANFFVAVEDWSGNIEAYQRYRTVTCRTCIEWYYQAGCKHWRYYICTIGYTDYRCAQGWQHNGNCVCNISSGPTPRDSTSSPTTLEATASVSGSTPTDPTSSPTTSEATESSSGLTPADPTSSPITSEATASSIPYIAVVVPIMLLLMLACALVTGFIMCKKKIAKKASVQPFDCSPQGDDVNRSYFKQRDINGPTEYVTLRI